MALGMNVTGTDNDWSTKCDLIINSAEVETGDDCAVAPPPTQWVNELGSSLGMVTGLTLGYRWERVRAEGEYLYRATTYDERSATRIGDVETLNKADQELEIADGGIDDVLSHNLFGNAYYDFASSSRFTPYVGFGVGVAHVSLDYFSRWKRNDDPDVITTFADRALREKLAGTTTIGIGKLSDTLLGYQALVGLDYRVSDGFTVGVKARRVGFGQFEAGEEWDQLRSHESTIGRGFQVRYGVTTGETSFWAIGLNMKYQF